MARLDPHSYADSTQATIDHIDWKARVDFASHTLDCEARLHLKAPARGALDLDTRDLAIADVTDGTGAPLRFGLAKPDPLLGTKLTVELGAETREVRIRYRTSAEALALQWLTPAQTYGGKHPFLFSQCQAVHARSVIPLQDTPRVRIRYRAELTVPAALRALMAAAFVRRELRGEEAIETYEMPQPIPPYLLAFAVGDLDSRELGPRSRVWAEPGLVDKAAYEFGEVDAMIRKAESMFGPYDWDRFDILTMPPSFPFGGMENPRLTFLTPTLLAGDRSLANVVAHELAHSWTGNLVTNANADHFWLNECFTVFAERRILDALNGPEVVALHAALGRQHLEKAIERFKDRPELTKLRMDLRGVDFDDAYSEVAYEKGYLFLRAVEEKVGRAAFDAFLRDYVAAFRFGSITTEEFVAFAEKRLPGALEAVGAREWLYEPGVPANAPAVRSKRLEQLVAVDANVPTPEQASTWTPIEWSLYLEWLPRPAPRALCEELDRRFGLTRSANYEVLVSWLVLAAESGYDAALPRVDEVLGSVGRMKYLRPLYTALARNEATRARARADFERFKASYHPIAQQVVAGVLEKHGA